MEQAYTPGPWKIAKRNSIFDDKIPLLWPAGGILADYADEFHVVFGCDEGLGFHSGKADAYLVAAAPELLEALRALVKANEDWNADVQQIIGRVPNWSDGYLNQARAAINKALGNSDTNLG